MVGPEGAPGSEPSEPPRPFARAAVPPFGAAAPGPSEKYGRSGRGVPPGGVVEEPGAEADLRGANQSLAGFSPAAGSSGSGAGASGRGTEPVRSLTPSASGALAMSLIGVRITTGGMGREPGMLMRIRVVSVVSVFGSSGSPVASGVSWPGDDGVP
ncbi:hypothetical protein CG740_11310 [Streptomyces sp. CB01201]|nr:hypothetical protein CG740_11310 [Streptomyces sp. CB01201]